MGDLLLVGIRILVRFSRQKPVSAADARRDEEEHRDDPIPEWNSRGTEVAATAGGITNGMIGAWGPVVTPFLLHRRLPPRFAIGSVNTAEVAVAVVASGSLLTQLGDTDLDVGIVLAMLIGGALAAPMAAYVIRYLPARGMGIAVSGLLMVTNSRELCNWAGIGPGRWAIYAVIVAVCLFCAWYPVREHRRNAAEAV